MTLLDPIIRSPRLPQYVRELKSILDAERHKRQRFWDEISEGDKTEFINGEVVVHSPVKLEHSDAVSNLAQLLRAHVTQNDLGWVGVEKVLVSLTRNDYEPDICYFATAKSAKFKPGQMKFPPPDLVVEVISSSTEKVDRTIKFEDYAAHGVDEYWIVDPHKRTIEQYLLQADAYQLSVKVKEGHVRSRAVKGLEVPVRAAFDAKENLKALAAIVGRSS